MLILYLSVIYCLNMVILAAVIFMILTSKKELLWRCSIYQICIRITTGVKCFLSISCLSWYWPFQRVYDGWCSTAFGEGGEIEFVEYCCSCVTCMYASITWYGLQCFPCCESFIRKKKYVCMYACDIWLKTTYNFLSQCAVMNSKELIKWHSWMTSISL